MRVVCILSACFFLLTSQGLARTADDTPMVTYEGRLEDGQQKPLGGVFPLSFSLHRGPRRGKTLWSESHFVAIDNGSYAVTLGQKRPISRGLNLEKLYLSVSITGGDEIMREKLSGTTVRPDDVRAAATKPTRPPTVGGGSRQVVDYAETAGLAYEAEHAKMADRLGSLTEEALEEKLKSTGSRVRIGGTKRYTASAGGDGGVAYELKCPKGHVVTGIRGAGGKYLDSIQLICSPLE